MQPDKPLSSEAQAAVDRELERRRRQRLSRLGIGAALVLSAAAALLSGLAFVDGRDHATKASVTLQDQRIDMVDEYARPLAGDLREAEAVLAKTCTRTAQLWADVPYAGNESYTAECQTYRATIAP